MDKLKEHVDRLFASHKETKDIRELKEEILGNLEAKVEDLTTSGLSHTEAILASVKDLGNIDQMLGNTRLVKMDMVRLELTQIGLLYALIIWIVTIPLRIIGASIILNSLLLLTAIILGAAYLILRTRQPHTKTQPTVIISNYNAIQHNVRIGWLVWVLFIVITSLWTGALKFGSNLWFGRIISTSGPYDFAVSAVDFALPLVTIVIPLMLRSYARLIVKYEVDG